MQKDSTTARPKSKRRTIADRKQGALDLTRHIIAVMTHPQTPAELYDAMADVILNMGDEVNGFLLPEVMRIVLPLALEREGEGRAEQ